MKSDAKNVHVSAIDDCERYREIAAIMCEMGYNIKHSAVRNNIIRFMIKLLERISQEYNEPVSSDRLYKIAKSPQFQDVVSEMLQMIEVNRFPRHI